MPAVTLRPYQEQARAAVATKVAAGKRALLTVLPTGTGKTVVFASEVLDRTAGGARALILAHREELIQQPLDALQRVSTDLEIGVVKAERNEYAARVVIASVQSLSQAKRLEAFSTTTRPALLITDEAHHAVASTYRRIYDALQAGEPQGPLHLGYTATPQRTDDVGLSEIFEEVAFSRDIKQMVTEGWLTEPRGRIVPVQIDLDTVQPNASGDYSDAGLDQAMDDEIMYAIAKAWWTHAQDRVTVAFTPSVRAARVLASAANEIAGAKVAEEVDGGTPTDERRRILTALKAGQVKMVANCGVLTEGFDAPNITCILVARPTQSEPLYTQMVGRGLRLWPGKTDCLVLDVTGISAIHSLCVLPMIFGLPTQDMAGKTVSQAASEIAEDARRHGMRLAELEQQVDLLRRRRHWAWTEVEQGRTYSVGIGRDARDNDMFVVVEAESQDVDAPWSAEVRRYQGRAVVDRLSLFVGAGDQAAEDAFGAAETWLAQSPQARTMAGGDGWRARSGGDPATPAQVAALRRWRIPVPTGLTKAQASDLLDRAIAGARLRGA